MEMEATTAELVRVPAHITAIGARVAVQLPLTPPIDRAPLRLPGLRFR